MSFLDDLLELFDAEVTGHLGYLDGSGSWFASGAAVTLPARYEASVRMVRNQRSGQEVVSSGLVILSGTLPTNDASLWRWTLPSSFGPHAEDVEAIAIRPESDESGIIYMELDLP